MEFATDSNRINAWQDKHYKHKCLAYHKIITQIKENTSKHIIQVTFFLPYLMNEIKFLITLIFTPHFVLNFECIIVVQII